MPPISPLPGTLTKPCHSKGLGCLTIPACTSAPINWIRCRDVRSSHLLLRKTKGRRGAVDTSVSGRDIKQDSPRSNSIHRPAAPGVETPQRAPTSTFSTLIFDTTGRMQVPHRQIGSYGYSVHNYAPAPLFPVHQVSQCAPPYKPSSGKSFTIDALLAKPEDTSPAQCGDKYHAAAPLLPLGGHAGLPLAAAAPCVCAPGVLPAALHTQPGYSVYCCPPFSYQQSCRAAFYAQGTAPVLPTLLNVRVASSSHVSETKCFSFPFFLCSLHVQSQRGPALLQNQRWEVETDAHQLHQRAALPAGEGVCAAAVHGRLGEVPAGLSPAAHRGSGEKTDRD